MYLLSILRSLTCAVLCVSACCVFDLSAQEVWALVDRYSTGLHSSPLWTRFQPAFDFTPPGRVLYYECMRVDDEEPTGESEVSQVTHT